MVLKRNLDSNFGKFGVFFQVLPNWLKEDTNTGFETKMKLLIRMSVFLENLIVGPVLQNLWVSLVVLHVLLKCIQPIKFQYFYGGNENSNKEF